MSGFLNEERETRTLREIVTRLREAYCGSIGYEYMHIPDRDRCNWLRERIETPNKQKFSVEKQLHTYDRLAWSEIFESFLANKYAAAKRFGLEGCETLVPGMKAMIDTSADLGVETICLGMPHRGKQHSHTHTHFHSQTGNLCAMLYAQLWYNVADAVLWSFVAWIVSVLHLCMMHWSIL